MTASDIGITFRIDKKGPLPGPSLLIYLLLISRPDGTAEVGSCRERRHLDHVAGLRRMDELVSAHEEAHVAPAAETEDVARLELADAHRRAAVGLVVGAVGDAHARSHLVAVHRKARA